MTCCFAGHTGQLILRFFAVSDAEAYMPEIKRLFPDVEVEYVLPVPTEKTIFVRIGGVPQTRRGIQIQYDKVFQMIEECFSEAVTSSNLGRRMYQPIPSYRPRQD